MPEYEDLADVYELLTPEPLRTREGNVAAFAPWLPEPGARVLDCACGIGLLAVGLALAGYATDASDLSPAMVARTQALAVEQGVDVHARVRAWEDLEPGPRYDAVLCVGNSLAHARERRVALRAMAATLKPGGTLLLTSRNWERERAAGSRTDVDGPITRTWTIPADIEAPHLLDVTVEGVHERLTVWPFTYATLTRDLDAAELTIVESTYAPEVERYLVVGRLSWT